MVRGISRSGLDRSGFCACAHPGTGRPPATARTPGGRGGPGKVAAAAAAAPAPRAVPGPSLRRGLFRASSGGAHPAQMVGPEDAGACSGRNPKLLPVPAPESAGQDGKMIRATGGFGGGVGAVEPPEEGEEEEETPPQQLLRRYLAAAGGQLEPGLCSCPLPAGQCRAPAPSAAPHQAPGSKHRGAEAADASAPRHGGMTNGDSGFLPGRDCRDLQEARGLARAGGRDPRHHRLPLEGPGDEGTDAAGRRSDWATPLEDPLRSCCLAAAADSPASGGSSSEDSEQPGAGAGGPEEGASPATSAERTRGGAGAEPRSGFSDVHLSSRNTFEVSRRQSARDHLPPAGPPGPSSVAEQGPAGTSARARRSGGFADFFARYSAGCAGLGACSGRAACWPSAAGGRLRAGSRWRPDLALICHRGRGTGSALCCLSP